MNSNLEYVIGLLVVVVVWLLWSTRNTDLREYFKSAAFKGILKGIVMVIAAALVIILVTSLSGCSGTYINDASIYTGLDYTNKTSPMCEPVGPDNHTTSNIGARLNVYQSDDERFRVNSKYTHHSCAFSPDDRSYDAVGVELEYKFWER